MESVSSDPDQPNPDHHTRDWTSMSSAFSTGCYSSVNLSPTNFPVKMSPYEREGDNEHKGTETIIGFE